MEHKKVIQKRPAPVLYFFAGIYFSLYCKIHHHLKIVGVKPKGPALILSNHTSNEDYKLIVAATYPRRVSFLSTYHWFTFKKLAFWLKRIGAIPKYQFATDLESMRKMQFVVQKQNGMVYLAPEGTVYANGKLGYIAPSIAKMVKFFKVPVYTCNIQGAGLGMAKWTKNKHDCQTRIETKLAITAEETKSLSKEEILSIIEKNLQYNEFEYQKKFNITSDAPDKAEGIETMFYKCPECGKEFCIRSEGNSVECTNCHAKAEILPSFRFKWNGEKQYFDNYIEWYDWQLEEMKKAVSDPEFKLEDEVEYGIDKPGVDNYIKVGKGILTFSHSGWDYKGTYNGSYIEEHDDPCQVFLATLKVGKHFELPIKDGHSRVYYPSNGLTSMKWHLASRAMSELLAENNN